MVWYTAGAKKILLGMTSKELSLISPEMGEFRELRQSHNITQLSKEAKGKFKSRILGLSQSIFRLLLTTYFPKMG